VREVKGFGAKTEAAILENIAFAKSPDHARLLWAEADAIVQDLLAWMRACPATRHVEGAGSWRRGRETVGDIDLVVESHDPTAVMDHLHAWKECGAGPAPRRHEDEHRGPQNVQIDLRVVEPASFGAAWRYSAGSEDHRRATAGPGPRPRPDDRRIRRAPARARQ